MQVYQNIQYTIAGERGVGKSTLKHFAMFERVGTMYNLQHNIFFGGKNFEYFCETDMILICFSIGDPESFKKAEKKWAKQIRKYGRGQPFIIIGTKSDLRDDEVTILRLKRLKNQQPISKEQGEAMAKRVGAVAYLEFSALHLESAEPIRDLMFKLYSDPPPRKSYDEACSIL